MEIDDFIIEINKGFSSIRELMAEGFKDAAKDTSLIHSELAALSERVEVVRDAQKKLEIEVVAMKEIEKKVDKNTQFRKTSSKAFWIAASVVISVATLAAIYGFAVYLINTGN